LIDNWINDLAGGPTRALPQSGGERRPNRHGVNTYVELQDRLRPTHPVCFFSALSLEKNTPSESA